MTSLKEEGRIYQCSQLEHGEQAELLRELSQKRVRPPGSKRTRTFCSASIIFPISDDYFCRCGTCSPMHGDHMLVIAS